MPAKHVNVNVLVLVLVLGSSTACVPYDVPPPPRAAATAVPDDNLIDPAIMAPLIRDAEETRHLRVVEPFESVTVTSEDVADFVRQKLAGLEIESAEQIMLAFGFIEPGTDLAALVVELLAQEVLGMYDPREDRLMVLQSVVDQLGGNRPDALMAHVVLVHEIVHALQDQHFDTLDDSSDEAWTDDAGSVAGCLAEGDATVAMLAWAAQRARRSDPTLEPGFRDRLLADNDATPDTEALREAPPYFRHVLAAEYLEGAGFVAELRRVGGWAAVDHAHRNRPRATRDILHTESYLTGQAITAITLPDALPGLASPAYERVAGATLGELETSAFLLPIDDVQRCRAAATGWAGDSFAVYRATDGGDLTLVWRLRFENAAEAAEFFTAAVDAGVGAGRGPCNVERPSPRAPEGAAQSAAALCHNSHDLLEQRTADIVILRNMPAGADAPALLSALFSAPSTEQSVPPPQPEALARWQSLGQPVDQ